MQSHMVATPLTTLARISTGPCGNQSANGNASPASFAAADTPPAPVTPDQHSSLKLTKDERLQLAGIYGTRTVNLRLTHDVFGNAQALRRQLAHETKTEISLAELGMIAPFSLLPGQTTLSWSVDRNTDDPPEIDHHQYQQICEDSREVGMVLSTIDSNGMCRVMTAKGRFGVPEGWTTDDKLTMQPDGFAKLRTTLTGPNGESGMIVRSFNGRTLFLDKAYKSTLPTRLAGVPDFKRPVSTINFLTARACKIMGVTENNLKEIKVNRLQHRPTLAHLDWLRRNHPGEPLSHLIDHTTWARSYIRETAEIVGHQLRAHPVIDLQGSPTWQAAHPEAPLREWEYLKEETERLTIKQLTNKKIPKADDPLVNWREVAAAAHIAYKSDRCKGLDPQQMQHVASEIDAMLLTRIDEIVQEESMLRRRYDIAPDGAPRHVNFDVTYQTGK